MEEEKEKERTVKRLSFSLSFFCRATVSTFRTVAKSSSALVSVREAAALPSGLLPPALLPAPRGLNSSTFWFNVSALCGIGGAEPWGRERGCPGVSGGV